MNLPANSPKEFAYMIEIVFISTLTLLSQYLYSTLGMILGYRYDYAVFSTRLLRGTSFGFSRDSVCSNPAC